MWFVSIGRRKRNDSDEDIQQALAELALEYSGAKPDNDNKIENNLESNEQKIDDEDKKKKGKKDKKKEKAEKEYIEDEAGKSMDGWGIWMVTSGLNTGIKKASRISLCLIVLIVLLY